MLSGCPNRAGRRVFGQGQSGPESA